MAVLIASLAVLVVALPVLAHHPFSAQYDQDHPVTMTGTVTKVEWTNPHAHIFMDAKDQKGQTMNWEIELGGLKRLRDIGWKKDTVKMGDQITVNGWKARDGSGHLNGNMITLANGTKYASGSSFFERSKSKPISD
jgi:hypothetical protein